MEIFKRITSAVALAIIIALPLSLLEALMIFHIVKLYQIPYLSNFHYSHILGISFVMMMTRNRIKLAEKDQETKDFFYEILYPSANRLFRILFVWTTAITIYQLFLK